MNSIQKKGFEEFWIVRRLTNVGNHMVILELVNEIFKSLDGEPCVKSKHFFWEGNDGFHLRIEVTDETNIEIIEKVVDEKFHRSKFSLNVGTYPYNGEWDDWIWDLKSGKKIECSGYGVA